MTTFFYTLFLLLISFSIVCSQSDLKANETCGSAYEAATGHFQIYKKGTSIPFDGKLTSCSWTIRVNKTLEKDSTGIFLFANTFILPPGYSLSLTVLKENKTQSYLADFTGKQEPFAIFASGYFEVNVTLNMVKSDEHGEFEMRYSTEGCNFNITTTDTGVFKFPYYEKNVPPFTCEFGLIPGSNTINTLHVAFREFTLPIDSLNVTGTTGDMDKSYTAANPPTELLAADRLELSLNVENTSLADNITLVYDLTTDSCSDVVTLSSKTKSHVLSSPHTDDTKFFTSQKFSCLWMLQSDKGTIINFDLTTVNLTGPTDQILILDGLSQSSPFITSVTQASLDSWKTKYIQTSSNAAWVAVNTPLAQSNFKVEITVTQTYGGFSSKPGPVMINSVDEGVYLYKLEMGKQVEFSFATTGTKIPPGGSIKFYSNFERNGEPIAIYDEKSKLLPVVSMEHTMTVVVTKFNGGFINATVSSRELGCFAEENGNAGSYSLGGNCTNLCSWKIPPKTNSSGQLQFHFTNVQLSDGDMLTIDDAKATEIITVSGPLSGLPDLIIPASEGVSVEIARKNCSTSKTVVQASFANNLGCESEQKAISGQTVELASPNFPNNYPLFANCTYKVMTDAATAFLHLSFDDISLALPGHVLTLYTLKTEKNKTEKVVLATFNSTMTQLPDDYLVSGNVYLNFVSPVVNKSQPLKSSTGFKVKILTIDNGGVFSGVSGNISSLSYPANVTVGSRFAWVVQVPAKNSSDAQNIISFHSDNKTKEDELKKFLTIYDGPSIRSQQLSNFSDNMLLSRTNTMIFLYQRLNLSQPGPAMSFEFQAQACNTSLMCKNGICMHEDWKCNNVNDCGDFSDERDCEGVAPGPPPTPVPPTPKQTGTSTTALTLGILASLIIGILLGVAAPAAYRRIAGNRFSSYSTFSNTGE